MIYVLKKPKISKSLKYFVASKILTYFGDLRYDMKYTFKIHECDVKTAMQLLQAGDVILTRTEHTFSELAIQGYWSHAALYVGDGLVMEAISDGVVKHGIYDALMHCDHFCVLRPSVLKDCEIQQAVAKALTLEGTLYDFFFDGRDKTMLFCSELIEVVYEPFGIIFDRDVKGRVLPESIYYNKDMIQLIEI